MSDWKRICALEDIPVLGARIVKRAGLPDIALFRNGQDKVFALEDQCPHRKGPLSQGIVTANAVTCPLHGWKIGLDSGEAAAPDVGCVPRYPVRIETGDIFIGF
ncbi:MAG: nitrite reductase small subunit NirD [Betaproteobacteria bacterium]|nr:nitrite reductase small subunit NirD [Betaproteobacteria bacterium]MDE2622466.1 nitrite reductase small subunit NirD [Betaproteobacteria bacterium]